VTGSRNGWGSRSNGQDDARFSKIALRQSPRISPYWSAAPKPKGFEFKGRDEMATLALERSRMGLATVRVTAPTRRRH
jgi:hypothetical protein